MNFLNLCLGLENVRDRSSIHYSCEDLNTLFKVMFPNCVSEKFALSRKKLGYVARGDLGPVILEIMWKL